MGQYDDVAILMTTYRRPHCLRRSLPQIAALGRPILVVDDGSPIATTQTGNYVEFGHSVFDVAERASPKLVCRSIEEAIRLSRPRDIYERGQDLENWVSNWRMEVDRVRAYPLR